MLHSTKMEGKTKYTCALQHVLILFEPRFCNAILLYCLPISVYCGRLVLHTTKLHRTY